MSGQGRIGRVDFTSVRLTDGFWAPMVRTSARATIPACLARCGETGRIANFEKAAKLRPGAFEGIYYNDSDVAKVLEGVAYHLHHERDTVLEARADAIIDAIAAAQWSDGYLNTYYTLTGPSARWTDMGMHEDYCLGHMIEAAVAYVQATGKRKLLDTALRAAGHLDATFGPGRRHWVPGHQEIELALVRLARLAGEDRFRTLAHWYLEERGRGHGKGFVWDRQEWGPPYCQDDRPAADLERITGHAVRAMYQYAAMADLAASGDEPRYLPALERLWDSTVNRNMYVTGGIGSSESNEGFTEDFDLPNDTAYCETCASVGMVYWNHRMFLLAGDARYAGIVERCLYNGSVSGVSLAGDAFFYANPMESDGTRHRKPWFDCSCCPTQIARFIPSVGNYLYAVSADSIWVNLYVDSEATVTVNGTAVRLRQRTLHPWEGRVALEVTPERKAGFGLRLRVPDWCGGEAAVSVNAEPLRRARTGTDGYLRIDRTWQPGDRLEADLAMPVLRVHADPRVRADAGRVCLRRGPLVYCFEECDNPAAFGRLHVSPRARFEVGDAEGLLPGSKRIEVANPDGSKFTAVPYFAWDNRAPGRMLVWAPERDRGDA
jgi:DUF1680 family protein